MISQKFNWKEAWSHNSPTPHPDNDGTGGSNFEASLLMTAEKMDTFRSPCPQQWRQDAKMTVMRVVDLGPLIHTLACNIGPKRHAAGSIALLEPEIRGYQPIGQSPRVEAGREGD